jgi:hypothetical protein
LSRGSRGFWNFIWVVKRFMKSSWLNDVFLEAAAAALELTPDDTGRMLIFFSSLG